MKKFLKSFNIFSKILRLKKMIRKVYFPVNDDSLFVPQLPKNANKGPNIYHYNTPPNGSFSSLCIYITKRFLISICIATICAITVSLFIFLSFYVDIPLISKIVINLSSLLFTKKFYNALFISSIFFLLITVLLSAFILAFILIALICATIFAIILIAKDKISSARITEKLKKGTDRFKPKETNNKIIPEIPHKFFKIPDLEKQEESKKIFIPKDMQFHLLTFLKIDELVQIFSSCKFFYKYVEDQSLIEMLAKRRGIKKLNKKNFPKTFWELTGMLTRTISIGTYYYKDENTIVVKIFQKLKRTFFKKHYLSLKEAYRLSNNSMIPNTEAFEWIMSAKIKTKNFENILYRCKNLRSLTSWFYIKPDYLKHFPNLRKLELENYYSNTNDIFSILKSININCKKLHTICFKLNPLYFRNITKEKPINVLINLFSYIITKTDNISFVKIKINFNPSKDDLITLSTTLVNKLKLEDLKISSQNILTYKLTYKLNNKKKTLTFLLGKSTF